MILDDGNFNNSNEFHPTHKWFLWSSIPLFIISLFIYLNFGNSAVDIQMHDTYFVIALTHLPMVCGVLMSFFALLYFITNFFLKKPLNKNFSILHFIMTWIPSLALLWLPLKLVIPTFSDIPIFTVYNPINMSAITFFSIFILGIVIFLFNFLRSFFLSLFSK